MLTNRFTVPYDQRTDPEKVETNWIKTRGLFDREDWSMSVVRAAICVELAANLVIRAVHKTQHTEAEIDAMLLKCNGIGLKYDRYVKETTKGTQAHSETKTLIGFAKKIAKQRNAIVHGGIFLNELGAKGMLDVAYKVIVPLVQRYDADFRLDEILVSKHLRRKSRTQPIDESVTSDVDITDANVLPVDSPY